MKNTGKKHFIPACIAVLLICSAVPVSAHRIIIEPPGDNFIAVKYDDGSPAAGAEVKLYGPEGAKIDSGITDKHGKFYFSGDQTPLRIIADDGRGHRAVRAEGHSGIARTLPVRAGALLGIAILLFIGAAFYYRGSLERS